MQRLAICICAARITSYAELHLPFSFHDPLDLLFIYAKLEYLWSASHLIWQAKPQFRTNLETHSNNYAKISSHRDGNADAHFDSSTYFTRIRQHDDTIQVRASNSHPRLTISSDKIMELIVFVFISEFSNSVFVLMLRFNIDLCAISACIRQTTPKTIASECSETKNAMNLVRRPNNAQQNTQFCSH